jgi:hypothetical protein
MALDAVKDKTLKGLGNRAMVILIIAMYKARGSLSFVTLKFDYISNQQYNGILALASIGGSFSVSILTRLPRGV